MNQREPDWRRYPYTADWGDPRSFTFPLCDGERANVSSSTWSINGFLRGCASDRRYAFLAIFSDTRLLRRRLRASYFTFALFDCDRGHYGTCTDYDFPRPLVVRQRARLAVAAGRMGLQYDGANASGRWESMLASRDAFRPFAWELALSGKDHHATTMQLELEIEATRPPAPLGGRDLGGEALYSARERHCAYTQSGLLMRGRLHWGEQNEEVEGDAGCIDRQWGEGTGRSLSAADRSSEWRSLQLDNGWDLTAGHQYLRTRHNVLVPWSGISAQGPTPDYELTASHRTELTVPEFTRSPALVRARSLPTEGPRYFPSRYRLQVPEWELAVVAEPLIAAPAHAGPTEVWSGPVVVRGTLRGKPVMGLGFDRRGRAWFRNFELAQALRSTVDNLSGADAELLRRISYRVWEVEALCLRRERAAAGRQFDQQVQPLLKQLPSEIAAQLEPLSSDLRALL